jgi:hypothetical protein
MSPPRRSAAPVPLLALLLAAVVLGPALAGGVAAAAPAGDPPASPTVDAAPSTSTGGPAPAADGARRAAGNGSNVTYVGVQGVGSYHSGGYLLALRNGTELWREGAEETYFDVTRLENGSLLVGYMSGGYDDCGRYEAPCARTGFRVVDPTPEPRVVHEWSFPVRTRTNSEIHDVEYLPERDEYLVADMEYERLVAVGPGGEATWEWSASSRYDAPDDPTTTDWLHVNDVDRIAPGRYLVSVRNANELVVVDREAGVVEVINEGGDPEVLDHQHNPQWLGEGHVLVADSENHRVVELRRDAEGDWEPVWVLTGADGSRFNWPRDADRLPNGHTLVTDSRNARVVEVDEAGRTVRVEQFDYRVIPYEADRDGIEPVAPNAPWSDGGDGDAADAGDGTTATPDPGSTSSSATPSGADVTPGRPVVVTPPDGDAGRTVPVLTPAYRLVSAAAPLPLWFGEWHLLATVAGLLSLGVGAFVRRRGD